jgi:putative ABC transport system permease protein
MMRALDRKLLRELARMKFQAAAIALVVASGMALFVATATTSRALTLSERRFYDDHRFAEIWSSLSRAPERVVRDLEAIPGVTAVEGRLVIQGVLDLPDVEEPATGLFIGIPATHGHTLNDVYIRRGRHIEVGARDEALVSEAFAEQNNLKPGDTVHAVIGGRRVAIRISGIAISPEFVMQVPPGALLPDDRRFGVFWMAGDRLADLLDLQGAVNDVALRMADAGAEQSIVAAVDRTLGPYGGRGAYGRATQRSHVMLENHIEPIVALSAVVPAIFLAVAVFLVNIVLSRVVAIERTQIGMLKAFGYSNGRLTMHYLLLALLIVAGGLAIGIPIGAWLGRMMSVWFATFFRFPVLVFLVEPLVVLIGIGTTVAATAIGVVGTLRRVALMTPAVAMAPPAPTYRPTLVDRLRVLRRWSPATRMIVRNLIRRPGRAILATVGMSMAIAIVVLGSFTDDAMTRVLEVRYQQQERQDLSVVLRHPRSLEQWSSVARLPGVRIAEPFRAVPARIRNGPRVRDVTIIGLAPDSRLRRIVGLNFERASVPAEGAVMNRWVAEQLDLARGQPIILEIREGRRQLVKTRIVELIDEPLGASVYVELGTLGRLLDEPDTFSAADVLTDPKHSADLYAALKRAPDAAAVEFRRVSIANFRAMSDDSIRFVRQIEIVFAIVIAFGVVYNTARIAVAERAHELATLRVLGFTRREISRVLLGEIGILALPAVPVGCALGYILCVWLTFSMSTELFRLPLIVNPGTYAFALSVFAAAAAGSALMVRRRLDRLDLIAVLKARE